MQLASSEVLQSYLFAASARSQEWDKEPEFQEFAEKKKQQLMLEALEEQAAAESGPIEGKDIRAYYDRNKGQFRVPESVVIRRLYVDTWEQARDLREEIDAGEELVRLLERPLVARHVHPQLQGVRRFFPHSRGALSGVGRGGIRCRDGRCRRACAGWERLRGF